MADTVSPEDVLSVFPHKVLTTITGEPTYQHMKIWRKQMSANLNAVKMPITWGIGKWLLGSFQAPVIFLARNGAVCNPPLNAHPPYPVIAVGATTAAHEEARAVHKIACKFW